MTDNSDMIMDIQAYRDVVLQYEAAHAAVNALLAANNGASENMTEADLSTYRHLARERDELFNEMRWLESQLFEESQVITVPPDDVPHDDYLSEQTDLGLSGATPAQ